MARKRSRYFVDKDALKQEIKTYQETEVMSEELGKMLLLMAKKYASKANFSGYSYKEDFVSFSIYRMIMMLKKIDCERPDSNPFSYLTQLMYWSFVATINKENKYAAEKNKYMEHCYNMFSDGEGIVANYNDDDYHY